MGLVENFQNEIELRKAARVVLKEPITVEELYSLMNERWDNHKYGGFKMSKLLFIKNIEFDDYMMMRYNVAITSLSGSERGADDMKNNVVQILGMQVINNNITGLKKEQKEQVKAVNDVKMGINREKIRGYEMAHMKLLCDGMREVLHDKV